MSRPLNPHGTYYAYLRKSRADAEAEAHGEGETLLRHEKMLIEFARKQNITIKKFYKEIVSGETIQDRPVIQKLLNDINDGSCDGVLVVEVERLARGDTSDQGTIAKYFKFSDTLIITPAKIYDPTDEFDEEYFEFGLFMSRREYKTINRRIQRGRIVSVKEGKWIASTAPDGFKKVPLKNDKGYTLEIDPDRAPIIELIFNLRFFGEKQADGTYKRLGRHLIAKKLDSMGIKPLVGEQWSTTTIRDILRNYAYIGKTCWGRKIEKKIMVDGKIKKTRIDNPDFLLVDGLHPAIIEDAIFYGVQKLEEEHKIAPVVSNEVLKNPLSGIVKCGKCGKWMTRAISNTKDNYYNLMCPNRNCDNISAPLYLIEEKLLEVLEKWLKGYILSFKSDQIAPEVDETAILENTLKNYEKELSVLENQHAKTYDLLEQGIYSVDTFKSRSQSLSDKIDTIVIELDKIKESIDDIEKRAHQNQVFIPEFQKVLDVYQKTDNMQAQNDMLKNIIDNVEYIKTQRNGKFFRNNANFKLIVHPKLPKI